MEPENRKEQFLANIAGEGTAPEPLTREEMYMKSIADKMAQVGETFTANYTVGEGEGGYYTATCDKTYDEVLAAYNAGKIVIANTTMSMGEDTELNVHMVCGGILGEDIQFSGTYVLGNPVNYLFSCIVHASDGIIAHIQGLQPAQS